MSVPLNQLVYSRVNNVHKRIAAKLWESRTSLPVEISKIQKQSIDVKAAQKQTYKLIKPGTSFSPSTKGMHDEFPWSQAWFKIKVPAAQKNERGRRYIEWEAHGESTVFIDGKPWAGLDCCHPDAPLPDHACTLYLDCGLWQTGIWGGTPPPAADGFIFRAAHVSVRDQLAWDTFHDLDVLISLLKKYFEKEGIEKSDGPGFAAPLEKVNPLFRKLIHQLNNACDAFDQDGLVACSKVLKQIYKRFKSDPLLGKASYVGHAHIDLVWLWPEHATYKKAVHTFATQLRLMERYKDYTFTMSQPPLMYHVKDQEPAQAKEIEQRIKEGRWEFTGGLEVEADTQIPVGEGLARSLIYGQERIKQVRGEISDTVWIPDVFGYSQCLPQLFSLAGVKNFYTTKILWTSISKFPHNSFTWKGPDGSEVLTHLAVAGYNCLIQPPESIDAVEEYRQSDVHDELLNAAGYGDGGGGATEGHCERLKRMADLAGMPRSQWSTVEQFFKRLSKVQKDLPTYRGELYLEYHRGVQTSQSDFKFNLRACERALQAREALRVISGQEALAPEEWLRYLFMHFHDAIPGSSINSVYGELNPELAQIAAHNQKSLASEWAGEKAQGFCVVNPLAIDRTAVVALPKQKHQALSDQHGRIYPVQNVGDQSFVAVSLDSLESVQLQKTSESSESSDITVSKTRLSNGIVDARFNKHGELAALSVNGEAILLQRPAGLYLHQDYPANYDAWDIDHAACWMGTPVCRDMNLIIVESGPVRAVLRATSSLGEQSQLEMDYILEAGAQALKVEMRVNWQEEHKLLRYQLDTDYRGSIARYGAPFGSVDRSQAEGLPAQEAQWEVPASRWAAALDGQNNGAALISEAKYGFSIKEGVMTLSLLRAPTYPDPVCDKGSHIIKFAITAHRDVSSEGLLSTAALADVLYTSTQVIKGVRTQESPIRFEQLGSVVPAWVMPARDQKGFLVRLHECAGAQQEIDIFVNQDVSAINTVDLMEQTIAQVKKVTSGHYRLKVNPHKILTLKCQR